jgi:hypothetical protein
VAARQAELQGAGRAGLAAAEKTSVGRALLSIASMIAMLFGIETEYSEDSYVLSDRAPGLARAFESVMAVVA